MSCDIANESIQLDLSSNIVSGAYSFIELALSVILLRAFRVIFEWYILKTVYEDRKPIRLTSTRLSLFCDPGLAPQQIARVSVFVVVLVIVLTTIGGFGIIGVTIQDFEKVTVKAKVGGVKNGNFINFKDHISPNGNLVSAAFLMVKRVPCQVLGPRKDVVYGSFNDIDDPMTVKWPYDTELNDSTCLKESSKYEDEIIRTESFITQTNNGASCRFSFDAKGLPKNRTVKIPPLSEQLVNCEYEVLELWCSSYLEVGCAGTLRFKERQAYGEIVFASLDGGKSIEAFLARYLHNDRSVTPVLKSMSFILSMGLLGKNAVTLPALRYVAMASFETNVVVRRLSGQKNVTRVNAILVGTTLGIAVLITLVTSGIAFGGWVIFVARAGRRRYNKFNSAMDALSCAAAETLRFEDCNNLMKRKRGVCLALKNGIVGPVEDGVVTDDDSFNG